MKAISTPAVFVYLLMTLFITESALAVSRTDFFQGSRNYKPPIIHTIQKKETLWKIAREYNVDFTQLAVINGLNNPDLIFPGKKIKIQKAGFISVIKKEEPVIETLPFNYTPAKTIAHVTRPNKDDPFAPENPSVSYEVKAPVLKPVEQTVKDTMVFKTYDKFVQWLSSSLGYPTDMTQARGQASFDPPTSPTYLNSETLYADTASGKESELAVFINNFSSHITSTTSPPPKSL